MKGRTNSPLKTFVLLCIVGGLAWAAYEYLYVQRVLAGAPVKGPMDEEMKQQIRDHVLKNFGNEECFQELGPVSYRFKEGSYRIDIVVGNGCDVRGRDLCEMISHSVEEAFHFKTQVWAYGSGGREVTRYVP